MSWPGFFPNFKSLCPVLYGDVSVMIHICAGKILVQENIAPVDGYVHLVHIFKRKLTWHGTSRTHLYVKTEVYARNEVHLTLNTIKFNYFVLLASVGESYVATQFHVVGCLKA